MNGFLPFNRTNFYFLKVEILKIIVYRIIVYEPMSFLKFGLQLGYWIASRDTEMVLKIFISRFLARFPNNLQLITFLNFLVIFELIDLKGPMNIVQVLLI